MACYLEVVRVYDIAGASHVVLGKAIIISSSKSSDSGQFLGFPNYPKNDSPYG